MSQRTVQLLDNKIGEPGAIFQFDGRAILFDAPLTLYNRDIKTSILHKLTHVLITHRHRDHFGGLDRLFFEVSPLPNFVLNQGGYKAIRSRYSSYNLNLEEFPDLTVTEISQEGALHFFLKDAELTIQHTPKNFVLFENKDFMIQAAPLKHGSISSIAYSYKEKDTIQIDKKALEESSLPPGPWLTKLKNSLLKPPSFIEIAGTKYPYSFFRKIMQIKRGYRISYASDFDISSQNTDVLVPLIQDSDVFLCEACYLHQDYPLAIQNNHQTAQSAAELARLAGAKHLKLFHHSRRYAREEGSEELFLEEAAKIFPAVS